MSDNKSLKPGWKVWRFDQIAINVTERAEPTPGDSELYIGLDHMQTGSLRISRWGSKTDLIGTKFKMRKGDILFARRNAYLKRVAIAPHDGLFSAHGMVLRAKQEAILPEFLPYFMQSDLFMNRAVEISVGSLSPTINWKAMAVQEFALPSTDEQGRIVQVLSAMRECAEAYEDAEVSLHKFLLSRTDDLFSGQMEDEAKAQVIGDIAEVQYGLTINAKRRAIEKQSPYLRVANVQRFHIDLSEVKDVGVDSKDDGCVLQRNDILVVEGHADIAELGRASIWEEQLPLCLHQNHLIRIRCRPEVDPYYVLEYVNSPAGRAYFRGRGKSTSGLNTLNSTVVREMPIPIPPHATQKSIADELKAARQRLKDIADRKEQHATVSKRLSMEIFGGEQG